MPPKSKKAVEKAQNKVIEDKTFGLKNKNRSAKVQAFVQNVQKNVKQNNNPEAKKKQAELDEKRKAKEEKEKYQQELAKLMRTVKEDKDGVGSESGSDAEEGEENEELVGDDGEYLWRPEDFEEVEAAGRLEERLEEERAALVGRTDLTPVTEESFRAWKERKILEAKQRDAERLKKAVQQFQKTGQGVSGRDLWDHDKSLFVDDDDAAAEYERDEEEEEMDYGDEEGAAAAPASKHVDPTSQ
jgi:hypothetical protein